MSHRKLLFNFLLCAMASAQFAQSQNVFVTPPGDGVLRPVSRFTADPFQPAGSAISAAQDTFLVLAAPSGNKYYFIGKSGNDTVVITDSSFNVVARRNLGTGASAAAVTPDGRYVVIAAGSIQILDTSSDQIIGQIDAGVQPNDVAVTSTRAFAVSNSSSRLTAIDLNTRSAVGSVPIGVPFAVAVGPTGFVYVSARNILYEINPNDLSFRNGAGINVNGDPGKPVFVPDTSGNLRVLLPNANPGTGSSLIVVDLVTRTQSPVAGGGVVLDRIVPVSPNRAYAISTGQQLFQVTLPGTIEPAFISGLSTGSGQARAIAASNEFPSARYLYVLSNATNTVSRVDLASNSVSGSFPLSSGGGGLSYAGPAATGTPAQIYAFNNGQFVNPGAQTAPLIIRVVDGTGRPLSGVPVQFSTAAPNAFITSSTPATDAEGYAQAIVTAPGSFGQFIVTANVGSGVTLSTNFTMTVGTGTVGPTGLVSVRGGNGQVVRESATTPEPLRVVVRDQAGNPVPNAVVTWSVTTNNGPNGSLAFTQTITDFQGETTNTFIAPIIGQTFFTSSYLQSVITASTFSGQVTLYVTTIPNVFQGNLVPLPTVTLLAPVNTDTIRGQVGTTIPGAIQVRIASASGLSAGSPIPNVGISVTSGLDSSIAPSVRCADNTGLSDASGIATCDLVIGGRIGETPITVSLGGQTAATLLLVATPGLPGKVTVIQGDGQNGSPGQTLPLALVARIEDNFGNVLPGADVQWTVESGGSTLLNSINRSDNQGRVSTLVRLGNTPGPSRIRVTATGGSTSANATFTVNINIGATTIVRMSGDGQSAIVNTAFGEPLVAQVRDANNAAVPGVQVNFSVRSGSATLSSASATSDGGGLVRTSVTAGATAGDVTVVAEFGGSSVSWTLTVRPVGPALSASGITNAASGLTQIAPGTVVTIRGTNIVPSVRGYLLPANDVGPLPTTLGGVTVTFGGVAAPIFYAANVDGQESITVQVPFEAPENSTVPVTVTSGGTSNSVSIPISTYAPGIFETTDSQGRKYAVAVREDGSFVTPDNPIARGSVGRVYVTGLGRTADPTAATGSNGAGQGLRGNPTVVVGLNDAGVRVVSTQYAANLIGVYVVAFEVPQGTAAGNNQGIAVAVESGGGLIFSNGSSIAIR